MTQSVHIDAESVSSISRKARSIAEAMPDALPKARNAVDDAVSGNEGTLVADTLASGFGAWSGQYDLLTRQVDGFAADLHNAVTTWHELEAGNIEVFARYGQDL